MRALAVAETELDEDLLAGAARRVLSFQGMAETRTRGRYGAHDPPGMDWTLQNDRKDNGNSLRIVDRLIKNKEGGVTGG